MLVQSGIDGLTAIFIKGAQIKIGGDFQFLVLSNPRRLKDQFGKKSAPKFRKWIYLPGTIFNLNDDD